MEKLVRLSRIFFELGVLGSILGTIIGFFERSEDSISYQQAIEKMPSMKTFVIVVLVFIIVAQLVGLFIRLHLERTNHYVAAAVFTFILYFGSPFAIASGALLLVANERKKPNEVVEESYDFKEEFGKKNDF